MGVKNMVFSWWGVNCAAVSAVIISCDQGVDIQGHWGMYLFSTWVLKWARWALFAGLFFSAGAGVQAQPTALAPIKVAVIESFSGPFANTGEAVWRNIAWAVERVAQRGGVKMPSGSRPLALERYDSKGQVEEALAALRLAIDGGARVVLQGNSSAIAAALIEAVQRHNDRDPSRQVLFLNYSAVDPALTQERCNFWHFRFDAHADMRMKALMDVMQADPSVERVYLIAQDYSFGQAFVREAKRQMAQMQRPPKLVGEELHPMGRVKDFMPYVQKIKASGAQAVITGNWGQDLSLLVKAARDAGYGGSFFTFYGNALGAPQAMGEAGVGKVYAVAEWMPNVVGAEALAFYAAFKQRFPQPQDDYVHMRMHIMMEMWVRAIESAGSTEAQVVAFQLERAQLTFYGHSAQMRESDHQLQQNLVVGLMDKLGQPGVKHDSEGSGYGFRVIKTLTARQAEFPSRCQMTRPLMNPSAEPRR
jgi:branched-chain amino acid transport system substrate-binding protein